MQRSFPIPIPVGLAGFRPLVPPRLNPAGDLGVINLPQHPFHQVPQKIFRSPAVPIRPKNVMLSSAIGVLPDFGCLLVISTYRSSRWPPISPFDLHHFRGLYQRQAVAHSSSSLRTAHDGAWRGAWEAIRDVQSIQAFCRRLRPKGKPHYLTRGLKAHISHLSSAAPAKRSNH